MAIPDSPDFVAAIKAFVEALPVPWSTDKQVRMLARFNYNYPEYALPGEHQGKMEDPDTGEWVVVTPRHFCNLKIKRYVMGMLKAGEGDLRRDEAAALIEEWNLDT